MSLREEQCNKVCRILDDVLANRPTERDSLIIAVRKAFEADPHWIPVTERPPEVGKSVMICDAYGDICIGHRTNSGYYFPDFCGDKIKDVRAWAELPEPYKGGGDGMSRLDQVIADITYVRSCLKLLKAIQESGNCNICKKKRACEYAPKWGEQVRYNCPFFESEVTE